MHDPNNSCLDVACFWYLPLPWQKLMVFTKWGSRAYQSVLFFNSVVWWHWSWAVANIFGWLNFNAAHCFQLCEQSEESCYRNHPNQPCTADLLELGMCFARTKSCCQNTVYQHVELFKVMVWKFLKEYTNISLRNDPYLDSWISSQYWRNKKFLLCEQCRLNITQQLPISCASVPCRWNRMFFRSCFEKISWKVWFESLLK